MARTRMGFKNEGAQSLSVVFAFATILASSLVSFSFEVLSATSLSLSSLPAELSVHLSSLLRQRVSHNNNSLMEAAAAGESLFYWEIANISTNIPPEPRHLDFDNSTTYGYREYLTSLRGVDREYYTIRINTYRRHAQLALSVHHHMTCPGVAQIQIIWSEPEAPPTIITDLVNRSNNKVILEYHSINSLNERFNILQPTPTLGILSMDDDVLRPCVALDAGFYLWVENSHNLVGYDARGHILKNGDWFYRGDFQLTKLGYSMTLPRFSFLHRDYLHWYTTSLPQSIKEYITARLNCEDLAMSMFVTKLTGGERPLLVDHWARGSVLQLQSHNGISNKKKHRAERSICLNKFIDPLGVRHSMTMGPSPDWNSSFVDTAPINLLNTNPRYQAVKQFWYRVNRLNPVQMRSEAKKLQLEMIEHHWPILEAMNATYLIPSRNDVRGPHGVKK